METLNNFLELIINNSIIVGVSMLFLVGAYVSNILFSMYYNLGVKKQKFSIKKILNSVCKILCVVLGSFILCSVISTFTIFLNYVGISLTEDTIKWLTVATVLTINTEQTVAYIKEALDKYKKIINKTDTGGADR